MKKFSVYGFVMVVVGLLFVAAAGSTVQSQSNGFQISNGRILDANGNDFIMRGVNHPHTWYLQHTGSFADIKAADANTVRVVLSSGDRWTKNDATDVANVVQLCKTNRLICVLEVHDTTGYGEQGGAASLAQAVDYWISVQSALTGEEAYVIINIGNEPYGNQNYGQWVADTKNAIVAMRNAGIAHTIMVDAPNWGQDWSFTMRDNAQDVFNSDPAGNLIFSIHMYGVFDTSAEIEAYLKHFVDLGLPIIVGEFGHNHSDGNPDEDAILSWAETLGLGYLGWSWSGNGGGVEYLDMVNNFNANSLTTWGERLINGTNGLRATSQEASVFGPQQPTVTPGGPTLTPTTPPTATPVTPTATPSPAGPCAVDYAVTNQWNNGFQVDLTITNNSSSEIAGWKLEWTHALGQVVTSSWNGEIRQIGDRVTAELPATHWNGRIPANGGEVSFGFQGTHPGQVIIPTDFVLNGTPCHDDLPPTATNTSMPPTVTATATATPEPSITPTATGTPQTCPPNPAASASLTAMPTNVNIGDVIDLNFSTNLGLAQYTLYDGTDKIAVYQYGGGIEVFNESAVVEMVPEMTSPPQVRAIAAGTADLRIQVSGEIIGYQLVQGQCETYFYFTGATSNVVSVSVADGTPSPTTCSVDYVIANDWGSGFTANVTITNNDITAVNGWTLTYDFPGNQTITNAWNGNAVQTGQAVTVTDLDWNGTLAANGGSTSFGFNANYSGSNLSPANFSLNGEVCQ